MRYSKTALMKGREDCKSWFTGNQINHCLILERNSTVSASGKWTGAL